MNNTHTTRAATVWLLVGFVLLALALAIGVGQSGAYGFAAFIALLLGGVATLVGIVRAVTAGR